MLHLLFETGRRTTKDGAGVWFGRMTDGLTVWILVWIVLLLVQWPSPYGVTAAKILRAEGRDPQARQKTKMTRGPINF